MTIYVPGPEEVELLVDLMKQGIVPLRPEDESRPKFDPPISDDEDCCYSPDCPYSRGSR